MTGHSRVRFVRSLFVRPNSRDTFTGGNVFLRHSSFPDCETARTFRLSPCTHPFNFAVYCSSLNPNEEVLDQVASQTISFRSFLL